MGMFDKDKEMGLLLTSFFGEREEFIVWSAHIGRDDFPTKLGPAKQAVLEVSRKDNPGERYTVSTLAGAIADKVQEADDGDFPAVVYWTTAPSRFTGTATVLQFLRAWDGS